MNGKSPGKDGMDEIESQVYAMTAEEFQSLVAGNRGAYHIDEPSCMNEFGWDLAQNANYIVMPEGATTQEQIHLRQRSLEQIEGRIMEYYGTDTIEAAYKIMSEEGIEDVAVAKICGLDAMSTGQIHSAGDITMILPKLAPGSNGLVNLMNTHAVSDRLYDPIIADHQPHNMLD